MVEAPTLVTVKFKTSRAGLCGVHLSGIAYDVPEPFGRQVVDVEGVAEYVEPELVPSGADSIRTGRKKR